MQWNLLLKKAGYNLLHVCQPIAINEQFLWLSIDHQPVLILLTDIHWFIAFLIIDFHWLVAWRVYYLKFSLTESQGHRDGWNVTSDFSSSSLSTSSSCPLTSDKKSILCASLASFSDIDSWLMMREDNHVWKSSSSSSLFLLS